jgi:hypothetical protein
LTKLTSNLGNSRLIDEFKVEAADSPLKVFQAEKAAVGALISYVQVKLVIEPVDSLGFFVFIHAVHVLSSEE